MRSSSFAVATGASMPQPAMSPAPTSTASGTGGSTIRSSDCACLQLSAPPAASVPEASSFHVPVVSGPLTSTTLVSVYALEPCAGTGMSTVCVDVDDHPDAPLTPTCSLVIFAALPAVSWNVRLAVMRYLVSGSAALCVATSGVGVAVTVTLGCTFAGGVEGPEGESPPQLPD